MKLFLGLVACLFAVPLLAQTPTLVQSPATCHGTATPLTCQFSSNVGANSSGHAIIVGAFTNGTAATFAVTDGGNTYTSVTNSPLHAAGITNSSALQTAPITTGGGTKITVSTAFTSGGGQYEVEIAEIAGTVTSGSIVDVSNCAFTSGSSTTWSAPSLTTTNANDLVLASFGRSGNTATPTANSPFTAATSNSFWFMNILEYNGYSSIQTGLVPSAHNTATNPNLACDVAIKGPSTAGVVRHRAWVIQ